MFNKFSQQFQGGLLSQSEIKAAAVVHPTKQTIYAVKFRQKLDDWFDPLEKPLFRSMQQEVTRNEFQTVDKEKYNGIVSPCELLVNHKENVMMFRLHSSSTSSQRDCFGNLKCHTYSNIFAGHASRSSQCRICRFPNTAEW